MSGDEFLEKKVAAPLPAGDRLARLAAKAKARLAAEREAAAEALLGRPDATPELAVFAEILAEELDFEAMERRTGRRCAALMCLQAPQELFLALDIQPARLQCGSRAGIRAAPSELPALMCPSLKSLMGSLVASPAKGALVFLVPTTCDWVTGWPALAADRGLEPGPTRFLELPRRKESPSAARRWLEEIEELWVFLKKAVDRKAGRSELFSALKVLDRARSALARVTALRREGRVPAAWWFAAANAFSLMRVEDWTAAVQQAAKIFAGRSPFPGPGIFLSGSPLVFPNFKLLELLEEAGLNVLGDDMCVGERLIPKAVAPGDSSEAGLLAALAESVHEACLCPVFCDNSRRLGPVLEAVAEAPVAGLVFHLLKGCHPYEMDAVGLEPRLAERGLRFLRLETDYAAEDDRNLFSRLEAFRSSFGKI